MQPFDYLNTTTGLVWVAVCILLGFALTALGYFILNHIPAKWLCDYNETPSDELLSGKRFSFLPSGILISVLMSACLVLCRLQFNKGYDIYFCLLTLIIFVSVLITMADIKYYIIPDQFTIAVGILAAAISVYDIMRGYHILHSSWWSPIAGAFIGAAAMMLIDFIGMLVYHRDGMGFGDVKLFFAAGILTGFPGTIYAFIISIITATVFFVAIIIITKIAQGKTENVPELAEGDQSRTDEKSSADVISDKKEPEGKADESVCKTDEKLSEGEQPDKTEPQESVDDSGEKTSDEETEDTGLGSYLAFGPYIAGAVCLYVVLFDLVQYLAGLYLNLFQ